MITTEVDLSVSKETIRNTTVQTMEILECWDALTTIYYTVVILTASEIVPTSMALR